MREELRGDAEAVALALRDSMAEMKRVPVDDDGGQQVQAGDAEVPAFAGAVTDFTLPPDAQGVLERVVRFALVEPDLGTTLRHERTQPRTVECISARSWWVPERTAMVSSRYISPDRAKATSAASGPAPVAMTTNCRPDRAW